QEDTFFLRLAASRNFLELSLRASQLILLTRLNSRIGEHLSDQTKGLVQHFRFHDSFSGSRAHAPCHSTTPTEIPSEPAIQIHERQERAPVPLRTDDHSDIQSVRPAVRRVCVLKHAASREISQAIQGAKPHFGTKRSPCRLRS